MRAYSEFYSLLSTIQSKATSFPSLLVISKEHLYGQPGITTDLEAFRHAVKLLQLLLSQVPPVKLKVRFDAFLVDGLGDDRPSLLYAPCKQNLLRSLTLGLCKSKKCFVGIKRRIRAAEAGVSCAMDTFRGVVFDELWRRIVGVDLDLIDSRDNLRKI